MRILNFLFGTRTMGYLLTILALSMGVATFIESYYDAATAQILIYKTSWFETIFVLLTLNFIASISRYQLIKQKKWGVLLLHTAFILIIVGAGITRYIGYEGAISLKEGETTDEITTEKTYLTILIDGTHEAQPMRKTLLKELLLSAHVPTSWSMETNFKQQPIQIGITDYKEKMEKGLLTLSIQVGDSTETLQVMGGKGSIGQFFNAQLDSLTIWIRYGSIQKKLPFSIKLNDFIATKYPGTTNSYKSFESKVTVTHHTKQFDYAIFMNHTLNYEGYRLYQASFHPDEMGSILSVNHDYWGTLITYIGYFMLYASFLWILFLDPKSHFRSLQKKLKKIQQKQLCLIGLLILLCGHVNGQPFFHKLSTKQVDSMLVGTIVPKEISDQWGSLVVQDNGRMKPINTYASELLRKLSDKTYYGGLDANQSLLSMTTFPFYWYQVPLIKLPRKNKKIREQLGLNQEEKYAALTDFFSSTGFYKLSLSLQKAHLAKQPNVFEKDVINLDQKVNLLHQVLAGHALSIFPIPNNPSQKWVSQNDSLPNTLKRIDSIYIRRVFNMLGKQIEMAQTDNSSTTGIISILDAFKVFQKRHGGDIMPSERKVSIEIWYNQSNLFGRLYKIYFIIGILALIGGINLILKRKSNSLFFSALYYLTVLGLLIQTSGMITRWYISDHAPWSDAYESLLYVAWSSLLFTIILAKKSPLTLGGGLFAAGIILMVAHWNWLDPAISNLQPVLNSYWLLIHVAIIVSSYGPFTLSAILAIVALILMLFKTKQNQGQLNQKIRELTIINEMSITIGLCLLTIGNFLGGQWANESWGRYWGWDPKETWALISIIIYAFILHMRLIKGLRGFYPFNLMSLVGFASILMTYFGVNFYLSGLHSYASGEQIVTPTFVYVCVGSISFIALLIYFKNKRLG